jgi:peptidoglycan/LPS O-acetylase OafA/YrhL
MHPVYDFIVLCGCIAFAALFYHFVEAPSHKLAQFLSKNPINNISKYFARSRDV